MKIPLNKFIFSVYPYQLKKFLIWTWVFGVVLLHGGITKLRSDLIEVCGQPLYKLCFPTLEPFIFHRDSDHIPPAG
ncbi:hypothetical protein RchiOBHm_Chr3g0484781 [Rosa chinensis]|uniref:Uncharacterized protein n=1 Tax=Rosa chinensis TaxID=74649 RepID=A0A2P6RET5_ROSCH|nr:hypothetical protein RchiOBHm_Chr3g0484781 [Rosa chinensis]